MDREKAIDKIKKLLRLSKSDNLGEANAALRAAQELMAKYNVEVTSEEDKISVVEMAIQFGTKSISNEKRRLMDALAKNFRCEWYYGGSNLYILGYENDCLVLKDVFDWICVVYDKLAAKFLKEERLRRGTWDRHIANKCKYNYLCGFCSGVKKSLEVNNVEKGLMIVVPNAVTKEMESLGLTTKAHTTTIALDDDISILAGLRDGKEVLSLRNTIE